MAYTITTSLLNRLIALAKGAELSSSDCKGTIFNELVQEGLLITIPKGRGSCCKAPNGKALRVYLATRDDAFKDLEKTEAIYREISCSEDGTTPFAPRNIQASTTGNSKIRKTRSCKGFLVNCYEPILASLNEKKFEINPPEGSFVFITDYESFFIPENVIVVGVENMENFRYISRQQKLFQDYLIKCFGDSNYTHASLLFVSRYPQSSDLVKWLQNSKNLYIHFGDLDLAGINIYLTEFFAKIGDRASFLIPPDADSHIANGSRERYDDQILKFEKMKVADKRVQPLVDLIRKYHKGYDQEGFID